ncbi:MAG: ABC transporter ATP-binding protein [Spirochaetales bacterium]|nr:ABC transporter ATP-binding protein [Spirochaetales bacterium]
MTLLATEQLCHTFTDGTDGIRGVSVSFSKNEFVVIAGKNGSGKTVLMLHLNGLLKPTSGTVRYRGAALEKNLQLVRQKVGLVFQEPAQQLLGQTVEDDVAFGPENLGLSLNEVSDRTCVALKNLGIAHLAERQPHFLSGGEKRKVALAGVMAMAPEIVILDEPFAGLDLPGVSMILDAMILLYKQGHTIIVITHDIRKVVAHATRLLVMDDGSIVADGNPAAVIDQVEEFGIRGMAPGEKIGDMTWLR